MKRCLYGIMALLITTFSVLLPLTPLAFADTGNCTLTDIVTLSNGNTFLGEWQYGYIIMRFTIPEAARGSTCSAATLYMYQVDSGVNSLSGAEAGWTADSWSTSDSVSTLAGLSFSSLESKTVNTTNSTWKTWNVLGDSSKGLQKACSDSATSVTIILRKTGYSSMTDKDAVGSSAPALGEENKGGLDHKAFSGSGGTAPYIELTYTGGSGTTVRRPSGTAGVLIF